ncbi:MAG: hypothetical protein NT016_00035 [Candidatus Aenigmarchaeota archaeon]|nr:hypothetical protein [Candidatus Aenigmarchaeota archaeon]
MEIPIGYFFATAYFSFASGAIGVFIVMQILQLLGWADWLGKNKSTSIGKIYSAKSVDDLARIIMSEGNIYGEDGKTYHARGIVDMVKAIELYVDRKDVVPSSNPTPEEKQDIDMQTGILNYLKAEAVSDPFSIIPNKEIREKLKQLKSGYKLEREYTNPMTQVEPKKKFK